MCRGQSYFFLSGLHYYFWTQSWATGGDKDKHHTTHPVHGLPVSLGCAQDGRESCPAAVLHMVAGRDLLGRKRSKQSIVCPCFLCQPLEMAKLPHHRRGPPYSSSVLRNWLSAYEKGISYCPSPSKPLRRSQNPCPTPFPTKASGKVTVRSAFLIYIFPLYCVGSIKR